MNIIYGSIAMYILMSYYVEQLPRATSYSTGKLCIDQASAHYAGIIFDHNRDSKNVKHNASKTFAHRH